MARWCALHGRLSPFRETGADRSGYKPDQKVAGTPGIAPSRKDLEASQVTKTIRPYWVQSRDLNPESPAYEAGVLSITLPCNRIESCAALPEQADSACLSNRV